MFVGRVGMNWMVDVNWHYLFMKEGREDVSFSAPLGCIVNALD